MTIQWDKLVKKTTPNVSNLIRFNDFG